MLTVESHVGQGSAFTFSNWYEIVSLPVKNDGGQVKNNVLKTFDGVKVLLAEDNPINTFLIIKILKGWNIEVDVVENGKIAIDKIRENDYNLILMDTYMPVMNGLEAIRLIREGIVPGKENIPIINFSAAILDADRKMAIDAGANDILDKSFEPQLLHQKIAEMVLR
ncbi:Autoinducer 2 sensor kinase/phosphatase LuxQ [compost metagenome]